MLVQDGPTSISELRLGSATVLMDVCEERQAEGNHSLGGVSAGAGLH